MTQPQIRVGVRLEFFVAANGDHEELRAPVDVATATLAGVLVREDLIAATVPAPGDRIGQHTLGESVHELIGGGPEISHVEHFIRGPHNDERDPLPVIVCRIATAGSILERLDHFRDELTDAGWWVSGYCARLERTRA